MLTREDSLELERLDIPQKKRQLKRGVYESSEISVECWGSRKISRKMAPSSYYINWYRIYQDGDVFGLDWLHCAILASSSLAFSSGAPLTPVSLRIVNLKRVEHDLHTSSCAIE